MFCCVCFPMEGWHTGTLDSKLSIAPAYWLKTPKTEPTKTTNIANKTAPLASRCFYPVMSMVISLCFCLFDWNQVERLYFWVVQYSNFKDMSHRECVTAPFHLTVELLQDRSSKKRGSVTKILKPIWAWPSAKDVFWNA